MFDLKITGGTIVDGTGRAGRHRRRRDRGRPDRRGRHVRGPGAAHDRRARRARDAGLRRHPHALRRPGRVGRGAGAVVAARRDDVRDGQLRRRLRAGAPGREAALIELMEGVEDIPGAALAEGIPWGWESFAEYMDAIDAMPHAIDFLVQVPHDPLRMYVMGERAVADELATDDDIAAMRALLRDALEAGAAGLLDRAAPTTTAPRAAPRRRRPRSTRASSPGIARGVRRARSRRAPGGQRLRHDARPRPLRRRVRSARGDGRGERRPTALDLDDAARSRARPVAADPRARRAATAARPRRALPGRRARHRRAARARGDVPSVHGLPVVQGDRAPAARRARRAHARPRAPRAHPRRDQRQGRRRRHADPAARRLLPREPRHRRDAAVPHGRAPGLRAEARSTASPARRAARASRCSSASTTRCSRTTARRCSTSRSTTTRA